MHKTVKKLLFLLLSICILLANAVSCTNDAVSGADTDTSAAEPAVSGIAKYSIIYEPSSKLYATGVKNKIKAITGAEPKCVASSNAEAVEYEILIGDTGRSESTEFISSLKDYEYGVSIQGKKILIAGKLKDYTEEAVTLFIDDYLPKKGTGTELKKSEDTIMIEEEAKKFDELVASQKITWEGTSRLVQSGGYARMTTLPDGKLACVYSGGGYIRFCTSDNGGETWNAPINIIRIEKTPTGQTMTLANANIVVMKDGSYMVAFRAHTAGDKYDAFYSSIRYCISRDNGKTWSADTIVAENNHQGSQFTGFWEPHMIYIKDGRLAMYYASDCIGGTAEGYPFVKSMSYQHIIMHIYDEQNGKFGEPIIASNGENHNSRDGMPVVCKLSDGSYAMVIESSSMKSKYSFIVQILFSEDGISWSAPRNIWVPAVVKNYAGAPFIVTLPDGRIAVSFQATEGSGTTIANNNVNNSVMNVIISNKAVVYADKDTITQNDFERVYFNPIDTELKNAYSVWPAMHVHNGKLYCSADLGVCTSSTGRSGKGIYFRIGTIK